MEERRQELTRKFAIHAYENEKFNQWFKPALNTRETRAEPKLVQEVIARTERFKHTAIPQLAIIINKNRDEILKRKRNEYKCDQCHQTFESNPNLKRHMKWKHPYVTIVENNPQPHQSLNNT